MNKNKIDENVYIILNLINAILLKKYLDLLTLIFEVKIYTKSFVSLGNYSFTIKKQKISSFCALDKTNLRFYC